MRLDPNWLSLNHLKEGGVGLGVNGLIPVAGFTAKNVKDVMPDGDLALVVRRRP